MDITPARKKQVQKLVKTIIADLNKGDGGSKALWKILTALRGPDARSGSADQIKYRTTSRLRGVLGLKNEAIGAVVYYEEPEEGLSPADRDVVGYHFTRHYQDALFATRELGFKYKGK